MAYWKIFFVVISLLLAFPMEGGAANELPEIIKDFTPILAFVKRASRDVTIDAGALQGVKKGDLFTVYGKGEPIRHGTSVKGYKKRQLGLLQALRVKRHKTRCRVLKNTGPILVGAQVLRFSGLRVTLVPGHNVSLRGFQGFSRALKDALSSLQWVESTALPKYISGDLDPGRFGLDLIFVADASTLTVYGPDMSVLRKYDLDLGHRVENAPTKICLPTMLARSDLEPLGDIEGNMEQVAVANISGDELFEVYAITGDFLLTSRYKGAGQDEAFRVASQGEVPISMSVSGKDGILAVNILEEGIGLHSKVFRIGKDGLEELLGDVNLWLRFCLIDPDTGEWALIGQGYVPGREGGIQSPLYRLKVQDRKLLYEDELLSPPGFSLRRGVVWGKKFLFESRDGQVLFWESTKEGKKTPQVVTIDAQDRTMRPIFTLARPFVDRTGSSGMIVPMVQEGSRLSQLYVVFWKGGPRVRPYSEPLEGRVSGMDVVGGRLYIAITGQKGDTRLYMFSVSS